MRSLVAIAMLATLWLMAAMLSSGRGTATAARLPAPVNVYAHTLAGDMNPAVANLPPRVYVPNTTGNDVAVIDPTTFKVIDRFRVGTVPHHISPSWDMKHIYVDDLGSNQLTVIDPTTGKPTGTISVPGPYNLYFTPDGTKAIDVAELNSTLYFYNPQTWQRLGSVFISPAGVDHMDFTADGRYLLASTEYAGILVKVDVQAMKIVATLNLGGLPLDVRLSPDGSVVYVANQGTNGVSLVDPVTMKLHGFLPTGKGAHGLAVSRDTKSLYVTNRLAGTISVIDFATRQVVSTWKVGGSPDMAAVSPDGSQLWVSNRYSIYVSVVDTTTGAVIRTIRVGSRPHGLCFFPTPGRYSLGHNGMNR